MNYAVFENTATFAATNNAPEFGPLRKIYPDSATAHPHLFRRLSVPGICVGEAEIGVDLPVSAQPKGLHRADLDPTCTLEQQYDDPSTKTTILVNLFDVDPADQAYFEAAWREDAAFFRTQPGHLSAQLHQGIGNSRLFLNYAGIENTATVAATMDNPHFGQLRTLYPDSATAQPHLLRRLSVEGICVGDAA